MYRKSTKKNKLNTLKYGFSLGLAIMCSLSFSQTFTMGKKCRASLETAQSALHSQMYSEALELFGTFSSKCKTKDAKEATAVGKAEALNGLEQYSEAITEADKALDITKGKSLNGHFQKAIALNKSGDLEGSKASLEQVIALTENNQNISQRASNYGLLAALYERQLNDISSAQEFLNKAKQLDPNNINILIQEGTMYSTIKDFNRAFLSYDTAKGIDPSNVELATARVNSRLRMLETKYGTKKAQELRNKMTADEKVLVCEDLNTSKSLGLNDMNKDLFLALICNQ